MDEFDPLPGDGEDSYLGCLLGIISALIVMSSAMYLYRWLI